MLEYFELFSGSADFKEPCEKTFLAVEEARKEAHRLSSQKKLAAAEMRESKAARQESERYAAIAADLDRLRTKLVLLKRASLVRMYPTLLLFRFAHLLFSTFCPMKHHPRVKCSPPPPFLCSLLH